MSANVPIRRSVRGGRCRYSAPAFRCSPGYWYAPCFLVGYIHAGPVGTVYAICGPGSGRELSFTRWSERDESVDEVATCLGRGRSGALTPRRPQSRPDFAV